MTMVFNMTVFYENGVVQTRQDDEEALLAWLDEHNVTYKDFGLGIIWIEKIDPEIHTAFRLKWL